MKNLLSLLLLAALLAGCAPKTPQGASVTGLIDNLEKGAFVMGGPGGARDSVFLDETGHFIFEKPELTEPGTYYMIFGRDVIYLYLAPGMQMDFYADMNTFAESKGFSGTGSDINNYMAGKNPRAFDYNWFALSEEEFLFKADSVLAEQQAAFVSVEKVDPDDAFWVKEEAELLFGWANNLSTYPSYHGYYAQVQDFKVSESWYDFRNKLDVNNPAYVASPAFNQYVSTLVRSKAADKIKEIKEADSTAEVRTRMINLTVASEVIEEQKVLNHFWYSSVTDAMQWEDLSGMQEEIDFFTANCTDQEYIDKFNATWEEWKKLDKGAPMFDFEGKDLEGNTVKSTDFRGKYLYVDVWATWCGPCIYEIPYLKELEKDYHDRNIVFMSYSIDEDHAAWLKFVPENELGGVQIIGEKAWESQLCKDYKIRGVPTFMFFDPEGKIISAKMTRPSDKKTRDTFDSYNDL